MSNCPLDYGSVCPSHVPCECRGETTGQGDADWLRELADRIMHDVDVAGLNEADATRLVCIASTIGKRP